MMVGENAPKELIEKESLNVVSRLQTIKEELSCTATTLASLERFVFGKTATPDECIKEPECLMDELGLIAYYTSKVADYSKALSSLLGAY